MPGLAEGRPSLLVGDKVIVCEEGTCVCVCVYPVADRQGLMCIHDEITVNLLIFRWG